MMIERRKNGKDRFIKTSINIREGMMHDVHVRMSELRKEDFIDYLRDLIVIDVKYRILGTCDPVSLSQYQRDAGWRRRLEARRRCVDPEYEEHPDPPRKYSGSSAGLFRNPFVLGWFRRRTGAGSRVRTVKR